MSYIGRVVGVGATQDGNPVLLYGLSGRSPSSRARKAVVHGSRVAIEPYGEMTPEQKAEADRLIYDAIATTGPQHWKGFLPFGVVSNGKHTRSIYRKEWAQVDAGNYAFDPAAVMLGKTLQRWGHEGKVGDRYNTPRIAGLIELNPATGHEYHTVGIITDKTKYPHNVAVVPVIKGQANLISTYTGASTEPEAPRFNNFLEEIIRKTRIEGKTVQQLAEEMYEFMDPDFVVASAAAMYVPSKDTREIGWKLAVKNKN